MSNFVRTIALSLLLSPALAAPVVPNEQNGSLLLTSSELLRYTVDPVTHELTIPNTSLAANASLPEGTVWRQRGQDLLITLAAGTRVLLSPDSKTLSIAPQQPQAVPTDDREPLFIPLASADPALVAGLLSNLYANVRVQIDPRQRALVIQVNPADRALIVKVVKQLDVERPQVMFEAEILEVNKDTTSALGLQYDSIFTFKLTEGGDAPQLLKLGSLGRSPLTLSIGLNALKANGAARVLAQPRVTTLDGVEARINSTQTTPIVLPGGNGTASSVQNITTGITLRMTPKVAPDGTVEASLSISVSSPTGTTSQGVPQFSSREASTTVRVKNGEPIAIGGLLEDRNIQAEQKVPLLGDLPLIGKLFTTTRTETHHTDLIIVVTPRLVMDPNAR